MLSKVRPLPSDADFNLMGFKHTDEGFIGELTALIGIEDLRNAFGL